MVKWMIVAVLAATVGLCSGTLRASAGQTVDDDVAATVRVNPLRSQLLLAPSRVRVGDLVVGVLVVTNVSDQPVLVFRADLVFDAGALRQVLRIGALPLVLRAHASRMDLWLLRAARPGKFIVVASVAALTADLSTARMESGAELLEIRPR